MPWHILGIDGEFADARMVKKAYAQQLKHTRPDKDPEGFRRLREAYEIALYQVSAPEEGIVLSFDELLKKGAKPQLLQPGVTAKPVSKPLPVVVAEPLTREAPEQDRPPRRPFVLESNEDPLEAVVAATRSRDLIVLRKALLHFLRFTMHDPVHASALPGMIAATSGDVLEVVFSQIGADELVAELEDEQSAVSMAWISFWMHHAQPKRLANLGEAWLKYSYLLVQREEALVIALQLAMGLSLYRNELAHALSKIALPMVTAQDAERFEQLDSMLLIGKHMKSAAQEEKHFWTNVLVMQLEFNWHSKQPQMHLWKLSQMPDSEELLPLILPRLPREPMDEVNDEGIPRVYLPQPKVKHRRRRVKRTGYSGGSHGSRSSVDDGEGGGGRKALLKGTLIGFGILLALGLLGFLISLAF
jgi:hypothetical protein